MKEDDNFMLKFKYYKSNKPKPSLHDVISVENCHHVDKVVELPGTLQVDDRTKIFGLKAFNEWKTYSFLDHPGLLLIKNPFTSLGQRYWIRRCLKVYPRKPNKRNIDIEVDYEDWWESCHTIEGDKQLLKKLRWTTLGYHHNWDTKVYSDDCRTEFPEDLAELSDVVALYLGYTCFRAEAAIVNYYNMKSTLSAHTDHSEINLDAPLFSFSFGQSAIFLIGGQEKSATPSAILLESGDIMVMSKEARLCYHAVPKILPATTATPWNEEVNSVINNTPILKYIRNVGDFVADINLNVNNKEWSKFNDYIQESRINMNVRQVLNETQRYLTDPVLTMR